MSLASDDSAERVLCLVVVALFPRSFGLFARPGRLAGRLAHHAAQAHDVPARRDSQSNLTRWGDKLEYFTPHGGPGPSAGSG